MTVNGGGSTIVVAAGAACLCFNATVGVGKSSSASLLAKALASGRAAEVTAPAIMPIDIEVSERILELGYSSTTDRKRVRPLAIFKRWKAAKWLEMRRSQQMGLGRGGAKERLKNKRLPRTRHKLW